MIVVVQQANNDGLAVIAKERMSNPPGIESSETGAVRAGLKESQVHEGKESKDENVVQHMQRIARLA